MASCGIRYMYQSSVLSGLLMNSGADDGDSAENTDADGLSLASLNQEVVVPTDNPASKVAVDESLFLLEPPIEQLLSYDPSFELQGRRISNPPELKNMLYVETQRLRLMAMVKIHYCCFPASIMLFSVVLVKKRSAQETAELNNTSKAVEGEPKEKNGTPDAAIAADSITAPSNVETNERKGGRGGFTFFSKVLFHLIVIMF
jgi:hypothetical protein